MDYSEMTLEEVLRTYSSVKRHRTRCEREINSLIDLLKAQYLAPSEVRVNERNETKTNNERFCPPERNSNTHGDKLL